MDTMEKKEQTLQNNLVQTMFKERRKDRRWRNVRFFTLFAAFLALFFYLKTPKNENAEETLSKDPYVSLVRLEGVIAPDSELSAKRVIPQLMRAFSDKQAKGVVLVINSPGGTPVQASIIHDKILSLKQQFPDKKVVVLGEDALASGAYLIAVAADKIYVNADTLTGSIGVVMSSFGFDDAISKLGVTRRVYTAGRYKNRLDPFEPLKPEDVAKINDSLKAVHKNFIKVVLAGRKEKIRDNLNTVFSGDFWTGEQAVKLGLADNTGNLWDILPREFGVHHYRDCTEKKNVLHYLFESMSMKLHLHAYQNKELRAQL